MKRDYSKYIDFAVVSALALVPLLWFRPGYEVLAGYDFAVYLDPVSTLGRSLHLWSDAMAGGYDTSHEVSSIPYFLLFSLPVMLGGSLYTAEKFVFATVFVLQGLGMWYMLRVLFEDHPHVRLTSLTGAFVYALSYPVMAHFGRGNMMALLAYGLLPVLIGLVHRGLARSGRSWRYTALIAILSFPLAAVKGHPADFVVITGVALAFVLFRVLTAGARAVPALLFTARTLLALVLVSAWWIVPNAVYLTDFGLDKTDLVSEGFYNLDTLAYYSSGTSFLNTIRNDRLDLWFDIPPDAVFNPGIYSTPFFIAAGLFVPVAAFLVLVIERREKLLVFFSILAVSAIFLSKGSHPPLGRVFEWMYLNVPGFFFFRAPYRVFSSLVTFSVVPLFAFLAGSVAWRMRGGERSVGEGRLALLKIDSKAARGVGSALFVLAMVSASALYAWPLFTGSHLREYGTAREPGLFHDLPAGYADMALSEGDGKVYYPYQVYDTNTRWGYNGPDPSYELLRSPKVVSRPGGTVYIRYQRPVEKLNEVVWSWPYGDLASVLAVYNAGHVLLHEDMSPWVLPEYNFNSYLRGLLEKSGFERASDGPVKLYRNPRNLPRVYAPGSARLLAGDERAWPGLSLTGYMQKPFFVMTRDVAPSTLEDLLDSVGGIVFHGMNSVDAACEVLRGDFGVRLRRGRATVVAVPGRYALYAREAGEGLYTVVDGLPVKEGGRGGLDWKNLGRVELSGGGHEVERIGLWSDEYARDGEAELVVVPVPELERVTGHIEDRADDPGFEVAYLFDRMRPGSGRFGADGESYGLSVVNPRGFTRVERDGLSGEELHWEASPPGAPFEEHNGGFVLAPGPGRFDYRVYAPLRGVEAGKFPELRVRTEGLGRGTGVRLRLHVRNEDGQNRILEIGPEEFARGENGFDLRKLLVERVSPHGVNMVHGMEWLARGEGPARVEVGRPRMAGRFGVERKRPGRGPAITVEGIGNVTGGDDGAGGWNRAGRAAGGSVVSVPGDASGVLLARKETALAAASTEKAERAVVSNHTVSPTLREVSVAPGARHLVFSDSFDRDWRLTGPGGDLDPVKVNGHANGYFLERAGEETGADYTLEYVPQRYFTYSVVFSATALAGTVILGITRGRRRG